MVPCAPVLVPPLAGAAAAEVAGLTDAARRAAASLPRRWIAVGAGPRAMRIDPDARGTFAGYGVDVPVSLGGSGDRDPAALPLCALMAGWLRGQVNPEGSVEVRVYDSRLESDAAQACGRDLRAEIDADPDPIGVLVVADGAATLTASAPGGHDPQAEPVQQELDRALAGGDAAALTRLPDGIVGRVAYQVLAGLAPHPASATEFGRGAPYGVGYFAGTWSP